MVWVVNANRLLDPGKDMVLIVEEAGRVPGPIWTGPSNTSVKVVTTEGKIEP
jgi:hypothetical protein